MSDQQGPIPKRFKIARRWQWWAAAGCALFLACGFIGWPLGYFWPSAVSFLGFLPSVCLFSIRCYTCGWPAFTNYEAAEKLRGDDRFWTRLLGKEQGISLPLPERCSKCAARFVA